jgi:hypothetical protein
MQTSKGKRAASPPAISLIRGRHSEPPHNHKDIILREEEIKGPLAFKVLNSTFVEIYFPDGHRESYLIHPSRKYNLKLSDILPNWKRGARFIGIDRPEEDELKEVWGEAS